MARVLLINPSYVPSYSGSKGAITNPVFPTLGLATISASAMQRGDGEKIDITDEVSVAEAAGRIARAPQNLTLLNAWAVEAEGLDLISAKERAVIARFATYADQAIQVDDFPADFDMAAGMERRQAAEAALRKTTTKKAA